MKIGILGGSFNPVHVGHLRLGIEALENLGLDRLEFIPCFHPPHKSALHLLPFSLRLNLLKTSIAGLGQTGVNPVESLLPIPSYTWQTLERLAESGASQERWFIMGMKDFEIFDQWSRRRRIEELTHLAVAGQAKGDRNRFQALAERFWPEGVFSDPNRMVLPCGSEVVLYFIPRLEIDSTLVRRRWLEGKSIRHLVTDSCFDLLRENRRTVTEIWGRE
ncbi:MAG: nicotinate-nicotinamide nucleotide adenylyltransferase [Deltaproteobacteria bacterium]|nr:nicotinate-nicotinamide nucleotide adenylyltransferase [Deltaproteobacteria bacterium]